MPFSRVCLGPVIDRSDAHAEPFGGLLLLHANRYQLDRLGPRLQRDGGLRHIASIPGIRRQSAFQALLGRMVQMLHHLDHGHRRDEIQFHRTLSLLGTEYTIIFPLSLQENVRSPLSQSTANVCILSSTTDCVNELLHLPWTRLLYCSCSQRWFESVLIQA